MNNQQLQRVTFEQAKRLKVAGFDYPTPDYALISEGECKDYVWGSFNHNEHDDRVSAPTVALSLKWMRDVKLITAFVSRNAVGWYWCINKAACEPEIKYLFKYKYHTTYESAESALLDELLNLIEKKS